MNAATDGQALDALASSHGITRRYWDGTGALRCAGDEALVAVLRALGAPLEGPDDAAAALREPAGHAEPRIACLRQGDVAQVALPCSREAALVTEGGEQLALGIVSDGSIGLPRELAAGYHRVVGDGGDAVQLLVTPPRLPSLPSAWALFAPLYGLRRDGSSFASYGDLVRLAQWMTRGRGDATRGSAMIGTLPLLAGFFEEPFEPSPYSPISRAFWSELYVEPSAAPEAQGLRLASRARFGGRRIDYRAAMRERRTQIEALLAALDAEGGARHEAFERALANDDELARYAKFRAAVERYAFTWEGWPQAARDGRLQAGVDYEPKVARYHAYAQWLAREQVADAAARSSAGFYLDLPLGAHGGGYDRWRYAEDFAPGISAGAPPDAVFEGGQNWAFPPLDPRRSRSSVYAPLRAALRHHFEHASMLRIDHVMSLHRLFWIADGFTAADGVYVRYEAEELWSIVAIEASRARAGAGAAVVGEDLGTVPDEVRREMAERGALRMHVLPFEVCGDAKHAIRPAPIASLASLGTHDMEPFAAWWDAPATPRDAIAAFLGCEAAPATVLGALLAWLGQSDASVVCANLEDLWLERERQNLPGTEAGSTNWQRGFARSFEELGDDEALQALVDLLRGASVASPPRLAEAAR